MDYINSHATFLQKNTCQTLVKNNIDMEMDATYPKTSPEDALWTLYRQQTLKVRHAFLARVKREDFEANEALQMPGIYSREEMMEVSKQRMRDIIAGREQTLSHEDVMQIVDNAIAEAV